MCSPNPCQNKGICSMTTIDNSFNGIKYGYACQCQNGYTGSSCETSDYDLI